MLFQNQPLGDLSERKIQLQGDFLIIPSHNSDPNSLSLSLLHPHPKIPFWPSWNPVTPRFLPSPPSHTTKVSNLVKPLLTTSQHILFLQLPKIAFFYPAFPYTYSRLPVRQEAGTQCAPPPLYALDHAHFSQRPTIRNSTSERNSPNTVTNAETVAQQRPRATINPTISTASPPSNEAAGHPSRMARPSLCSLLLFLRLALRGRGLLHILGLSRLLLQLPGAFDGVSLHHHPVHRSQVMQGLDFIGAVDQPSEP